VHRPSGLQLLLLRLLLRLLLLLRSLQTTMAWLAQARLVANILTPLGSRHGEGHSRVEAMTWIRTSS